MKVLDLACEREHRFEGWFNSEADAVHQLTAHHIACPVCESRDIRKLLSAPRLNLGAPSASDAAREQGRAASQPGTQAAVKPPVSSADLAESESNAALPLLMRAVQHVLDQTENVGEQFAEEARKIHYQEAPERAIRGVTTPQERAELAEEGIDVLSLPIPASLNRTHH